jgi:hypothetical protein
MIPDLTDTPSPPPPPPPTIHEAELASGPSGLVDCGAELTFVEAVARRQGRRDVVVCGEDGTANKRLAGQIEAAVGPCTRPQPPERKAGPRALPHFHQVSRDPEGHMFYETDKRKARKKR